MGFRSQIIGDYTFNEWPGWFIYKWSRYFVIDQFSFVSKSEYKAYGDLASDLLEDLQKAINWSESKGNFELWYLHECGGCSKAIIQENAIHWCEPSGWELTDGITHNYCYGCSIPKELKANK